ncbi:MarR family transcriptional regulator (plasmid) [Paracoccus sp. MC1862]|nr:MarR family transcriptional regulator [Paracoccus sp. MC1862]
MVPFQPCIVRPPDTEITCPVKGVAGGEEQDRARQVLGTAEDPRRAASDTTPTIRPAPTTPKNTAIDALTAGLRNRPFCRLCQTANLLNKTGSRALADHGVTTRQWAILGALAGPRSQGGIPVGDLAGLLMVSRQNLTGMLSRLEARGLITRTVDKRGKRSRLIRMTREGRQRWAAMQPRINAFHAAALAGFSNPDTNAAMHHLENLRQNFVALERARGGGG